MKKRSPSLALSTLVPTGLVFALLFTGCPAPEPEGPTLSFLRERERWHATEVSAQAESMVGTAAADAEISLQIVARDGDTGEQLTFLVIAEADAEGRLLGTHEVRVFGSMASFDPVKGYERLQGVSNACTPNDLSLTSGTLTIEIHDPRARMLSGSFIANICNVADTEKAWTLGDGKFSSLSY